MPKEYLVLIGAVFGGLITLAVTALNLYFNNKKHKTEFKRDKIEEIYLLIHELYDYLEAGIQDPNRYSPPRMDVGRKGEVQKLRGDFESGFNAKKERLEMYINFYWDNLFTQTNGYIKEAENYLKKYLEVDSDSLEELNELQEKLGERRDYLLKAVYAEARKNY
ncbi:hypothetical protein A3863_14465 [Priestia endophytica]|uniref:hypothetical protein n=1 Tax=Priestia endophytica TaxID=135735 RepID=UPI000DCA42CF|nr:hypothetical protein [Priestia endophytica]RAS88195.1 hypothetical protein A3863_14465 [Priestia endophytica]